MMQKIKNILRHTSLYNTVGLYLTNTRDRLFDLKHGVDTSGIVHLRGLGIESSNAAFGSYYEGIDPRLFKRIVDSLEIKHENFHFIDFGSGKGRAILLASEYPFKKIVGVEFSPELHRIAMDNIRKYRSASQKCRDVESVYLDAIKYPIPREPVVLFLANPFGEDVLAPVLSNIQKSIEDYPRDVFILYVHPRLDHLLESNDALIKIESETWHSIYRGLRSPAKIS